MLNCCFGQETKFKYNIIIRTFENLCQLIVSKILGQNSYYNTIDMVLHILVELIKYWNLC